MRFGKPLWAAGLLAWLALALVVPPAGAAERNLVVAATKAQPAAELRHALVIGNADYPNAPLANPVNDARAVAERLAQLRFRVVLLENATQDQMYEAIRVFGDALRGGGVGLFYYAGHALQVRGRNYLLPARAQIQREDEIIYRTVDTGQILDKMESARNRVNVVILDACRNNPFGREFRNIVPGLAVVDAPYNTLIAFATAPGAVASDGAGRNGLYTQHLLQALATPGLSLEDVFKKVRTGVRQESAGRQVPWENTSLEVDFYFDPLPQQVVAAAPPAPDPLTVELAFWDSVKGSTDPEDYRAYLQRYPEGQFAALARNRLRALAPPPTPAPTVPPPVVTMPVPPPTATTLPSTAAGPVAAAPSAAASAPATAAPPAPAPTLASPLPAPVPLPAPSVGMPEIAPLRTLSGHTGEVLAVAVARSGVQALTGAADRSLRLWDLASGRELRVYLGHTAAVTAAVLSQDTRQLLSGSADRSVRLWDVASGVELARMTGHAGVVTGVALAPTARYAVTVDSDGEMVLWDLPGGRLMQRTRGDDRALRSVALSPDGRYLITGSDDGAVRLRDVGGLRPVRTFERATGAADAPIVTVAFSDDGRHIGAVDASGVVLRWDLASGALRQRVATGAQAPVRAALSADGTGALVAGADGQLALWEIDSGRALWRSGLGDRHASAVALGPRGTALALAASDDRRLLLWTLKR
jgi:hypothetical protein